MAFQLGRSFVGVLETMNPIAHVPGPTEIARQLGAVIEARAHYWTATVGLVNSGVIGQALWVLFPEVETTANDLPPYAC